MPGYLDDAEADAEHLTEVDDMGELVRQAPEPMSKPWSSSGVHGDRGRAPSSSRGPPVATASTLSKPLSTTSSSSHDLRNPTSARPTNHERQADEDVSAPLLECPLCRKRLETNNQGLNEHIDFCLSKQAIKEAQAASFQQPSRSRDGSLPPSKRKLGYKPSSNRQQTHADYGEGLLRFQKQS